MQYETVSVIRFRFAAGILFLIATNSIFGLEPIKLDDSVRELSIGGNLEILEDAGGKLTLNEIRSAEMAKFWVKSSKDIPGFGFTKATYWARFRLDSNRDRDYYLEIAYPHLDKIDLYIQTDETTVHGVAGDYLPFKERFLHYRNFVFSVNPFDAPESVYYLRFESESSMQFPTIIWTPDRFAEKKMEEMIGLGIYFGVMIVMFLYNLFIWISIRDKSYLYYVTYIFFALLFILSYQGFTYQYLWTGPPWLYNQFYPSLHYYPTIFMLLFTSYFLHTKENLVLLHRIYIILLITLIAGSFASFILNYRMGTVMGALLTIVSCVWMLAAGLIMAKRKYRPARFYLFAWITFLLGIIIFALKAFGVLPGNVITENAVLYGSALEVILLSLGLADKINDLQKQNEMEQAKTLEAEKKSSKVKDEFLSNLSHELNTPLSIVYGYSEMLAKSSGNQDKTALYSKNILENSKILTNYLSDLILVTDIESKLQIQKSSVNLQEMLSSIVEDLRPEMIERKIHCDLRLLENVELLCDPSLFRKAMTAIIKNAVVYNKPEGSFVVEMNVGVLGENSGRQNNSIRIADTGIGISKENLGRIFEKFFRADSSLTYKVSGVGVGLFIARRIIELHGGSIEVKVEPGQGSEFTVRLPA